VGGIVCHGKILVTVLRPAAVAAPMVIAVKPFLAPMAALSWAASLPRGRCVNRAVVTKTAAAQAIIA